MNSDRKELLQQLKAADLKSDVPSVSEENAQFLANLVETRNCINGLEVGTAHAYSTIWLADAFGKNGGHLTTIEHSPPSFNQAKINLYRAKLETAVTQHLGRAQDIISRLETAQVRTPKSPDFKGGFDFIFIDGIKKSTLEFFELASPLLLKDGVIVVDDVIKFKTKMQSFYDYLDHQTNWDYQIHKLDEDDGIMVIQRASL